jgi:hypothetical protein
VGALERSGWRQSALKARSEPKMLTCVWGQLREGCLGGVALEARSEPEMLACATAAGPRRRHDAAARRRPGSREP